MKTKWDVIKKPLVTEKGTGLTATLNQYVFEVAKEANRLEVKNAVEALFKVEVKNVRTLMVRGKTKTYRRTIGQRPNWKKAYVTLAQGNKIEIIQGV